MKHGLTPQQKEYAMERLKVVARELWNEMDLIKREIKKRQIRALKISLGAESIGPQANLLSN